MKSGVLLAPGATAQLQFNAATGKFDLVKIDAKGGALYHLESSKIPGLTIDVNAAKLGATVGTDQRTGVTTVGPTVTALEASAHGATSIKWSQDGQEKFSVGLEGYGKVAVGNFSLGYVDNNGHGGFGSAQLVSVTAGGAVTLPRILTLRDEVTIGSTTSIPDGASMGWSNLLAVDGVGKKGSVVNQFGLGWQHNQDGARVDGDAGFAKNVTSNFLLLRWTPKLPGDGKSDAN
ncbi:MAG: hypothetical protein HY075_00430 [Deltaproteobacteria bacterium]|nr:hypothetical protein [Deltaproteobacteria bacterium]